MKTEYEKMLLGELYDAGDPELLSMRIRVRELLQVYNQSPYNREKRSGLLNKVLGKMGSSIDIQAPFFCDYSCHIEVGNNLFANF